MHPNPSIRVAAVVLTNDADQVALVRKVQTTALIFPGGKPEPGETARAAAARELHEELGIVVVAEEMDYVGEYTTPAANEAATELQSEVYSTHLPPGQHARAQAEIAQLWWVDPAALDVPTGYRLAPLSSRVLHQLVQGTVPGQHR